MHADLIVCRPKQQSVPQTVQVSVRTCPGAREPCAILEFPCGHSSDRCVRCGGWCSVAVLERSAVLLLATTAVLPAEAQSRTPDAQATPASALVEAQRAFRSGQYDLVDQLLPPPAGASPDAVLLRARAAIARGRYEDAVASLTPLAMADRGGPAALELGLLHRTLGRPAEAERFLQAVIQRA